MVRLEVSVKQKIIELLDGHTVTSVAEIVGTSRSTVNRVRKEYNEGVFSLDASGDIADISAKVDDMIPDADESETPSLSDLMQDAMDELNYIITPINAVFTVDGETTTIDVTHPNYDAVITALTSGDGTTAFDLANVGKSIETFMLGNVEIKNGFVYYGDLKIDGGMTGRILDAMEEGDRSAVTKLVRFFDNLMENPSNRAVNELYKFLEAADIEITDDGHFLAYKNVRSDFKDIHSNTMDNSPGKEVRVPRNQVDEDSNTTCSYGLHVASKSYLPYYSNAGGKTVVCKVHPKDVVAVPADYNNAKMRCAGYQVLREL